MNLNLTSQIEAKLLNGEVEANVDEEPTLVERFGHLFGKAQAGSGNRAEHPENFLDGFGETKSTR